MAENAVRIDSIAGQFQTSVGTAVPGPNLGVGLQVATGSLISGSSLTAASALNTVGSVVDFGSGRANITAAIITSAGVSAGAVRLEVSQDNTNWLTSRTAITTNAASTVFQDTLTGGAWRYARTTISTGITGGTVSTTIMAS